MFELLLALFSWIFFAIIIFGLTIVLTFIITTIVGFIIVIISTISASLLIIKGPKTLNYILMVLGTVSGLACGSVITTLLSATDHFGILDTHLIIKIIPIIISGLLGFLLSKLSSKLINRLLIYIKVKN